MAGWAIIVTRAGLRACAESSVTEDASSSAVWSKAVDRLKLGVAKSVFEILVDGTMPDVDPARLARRRQVELVATPPTASDGGEPPAAIDAVRCSFGFGVVACR